MRRDPFAPGAEPPRKSSGSLGARKLTFVMVKRGAVPGEARAKRERKTRQMGSGVRLHRSLKHEDNGSHEFEVKQSNRSLA